MVERALQIAEACVEDMEEYTGYMHKHFKASQVQMKPRDILENIFYFRVCSYTEQIALVNHLDKFISENKDVKVVIVDSITFHFRQDFDDLAQRTRVLSEMALKFMKLAKKFSLAVVLLNQVTTKYTEGSFQLALALGRLLRFSRLPTLSIFPKFSPLSALMDASNLGSSNKPAFSSFSQSSRSGGRGRGNERDNDRRRPQGRGGGGGGRGGEGGNDRIDALGRLLTRILRHLATEMRLDMRGDGFVKVEDLLNLNLKTSANVQLKSHTVDEIREAVRRDNKQRFSLVEEDGELLIRANQGHSITTVESDKLLKPILSPEEAPVCVHGTYKKNLEFILASGLKRMNRLHVHFSCGLPTDGEVISGMRRDVNVLIFLDIKKALEDGIAFYISDNKVILTEGVDGVVPVDYFHKIESWPSRQPILF